MEFHLDSLFGYLGQVGEMLMTNLQMANLAAIMANSGVLLHTSYGDGLYSGRRHHI